MFKTTKAKIIFVVIFSIICIVITTILVLYKNIEIEDKNIESTEEVEEQNKEKDVPGIDLSGTYNENDLTYEEKSVTEDKVEIRYFQISGLKNKTIENKINKEIEEIALNCYKEKVKDLDEVVNVYVSMWNASNFGNTISFEMDYIAKIDNDEDDFYQDVKGLNYDLNTGERIKFNEVFTSDAPIEDILRKSTYYSLLEGKTEDNLSGELVVSDYGNIEEDIAEIINLYKKDKLTEFTYTPRSITIFYGKNQIITIDMEKYAEYIAIYSRYLCKESLFENDDVGINNIYTLSRRYSGIYYYENYQKEKNYFVDISIDFQSAAADEFAKKLVENKITEIEDEIEKVKQLVAQNPNNFYILNYHISIYTGEEWSTKEILTNCYERGNSYKMTVHDFEENVEPIIIKYNRQEESGAVPDYVYDFSNMLKIEPQNINEYYNPKTGEKIVI